MFKTNITKEEEIKCVQTEMSATDYLWRWQFHIDSIILLKIPTKYVQNW